jgi:SAM-dependent methyltransferase
VSSGTSGEALSTESPTVDSRLASELERQALWQDVECGAYTADLSLWRELVTDASVGACGECRLLDLGSGTGRVSLALAGESCRVVALDSDPTLVATLRNRAGERQVPVEALVADARSFDLDRQFDLVLAPMQLAQLLPSQAERRSMLECIARHLAPGGRAALALLEPEGDWQADAGSLPAPDMLEDVDGWVYSSQPVSVRRVDRGRTLELGRLRQVVSPDGGRAEVLARDRLSLFRPDDLERDAGATGLIPEQRRAVPATPDHVASTVVVLKPSGMDPRG